MTKNNNHFDDSGSQSANQSNLMSEDPKDGDRLTSNPEAKDTTAAEKAPPQDQQNQATVEEFGREGMGVSAKE